MKAELIEDGGSAAGSEDFFRCPEFLAAERTTHSLRLGGLAAPLIVREIGETELRDAVSPYGYPGGTLSGSPPGPAEVDWSDTGLVSVFIRDRIGADGCLRGGNERGTVRIADPTKRSGIRPRLREQIRAAERAGYRAELIAGPAAGEADRAGFERAYEQTMRRNEAAERYFFGSAYFAAVLASPLSTLLLARDAAGEAAAGAIAVLSDGVLHYYLGGTADRHLDASPMKNLFAAMIEQAGELGVPLSLGGGMHPGDGLDRFKRGFANGELPFRTHEIVCDRAAYDELSAGRPESGDFFPAYRA